ncbi:MAG: hypothetical protein LBK97_00510, partial [Prevotellaceae bacterium]|nr:hypothetical protein [Prevotellaceae bacterium]
GTAILHLYVPKGSETKYKAADGWKDFGYIVEQNNFSVIPQIISKIIPEQIDEAGNLKIQARVQSQYPITEMRYRVDEQNDVFVPIDDRKIDLSFSRICNNPNLGAGTHKFYMQFKNSAGYWSSQDESLFMKFSTEQTDMDLNATVEDSLVRLSWNSVANANSYKLTRDGYVIYPFKTTRHPITMSYIDYPGEGNHVYKVVAYNKDEYVQKTSPEQTISISENNITPDVHQYGTVLGQIVDENGVEIEGVDFQLRYLVNYNTTETIKTVYTTSEKGRYRYQGIPYEQNVYIHPSKEGYTFEAYSSSGYPALTTFCPTEKKPIVTINFKGKLEENAVEAPQTPDLQLRTPLFSFNDIYVLQMNEFTFDIKNISYQSFDGEVRLFLESTDGKTQQCIGTQRVNLTENETKSISITVPAQTITLHPANYNLILRSTKNTNIHLDNLKLIADVSPSYISTAGNVKNPTPVTISGEIPKDLVYWKDQIIDALNGIKSGVNKAYSYLATYTKFEKIIAPDADHITGKEVNLILLGDIIGDIGKAKDLIEMKEKAEKYINYITTYNQVVQGGLTEEMGFKLFCKVAGAFSSSVPLLKEYIEVLEKAHDVIKGYGDYLFNKWTMFGEMEIDNNPICFSIKVQKNNVYDSYYDALDIGRSISHVCVQALSKEGNLVGREADFIPCYLDCCNSGSKKLYLTQSSKVFGGDIGKAVAFQADGGVYVMKIEWTNGRISYVPLNENFYIYSSISRSVEIEFMSRIDLNFIEKIAWFYTPSEHMANKIYLKYYGE